MDAGHDPRRFALDLLERLRDLILMQAVSDASERGLVDAPEAELVTMREQIQRVGPATLTRFAETVHAGLSEMRGATAPRLLLEVMCARMLLPSASDTESAVLQRLERLEQGIPAAGVAAAPRAAATPAPTVPPLEPEIASKFQRPSQRKAEPEARPEPAAPAPAAAPPVVEAPVVETPTVEIVEPPVAEAPVVEAPVAEAPIVEAPVVEPPVTAPVEAEELIGLAEPEPDYEPEPSSTSRRLPKLRRSRQAPQSRLSVNRGTPCATRSVNETRFFRPCCPLRRFTTCADMSLSSLTAHRFWVLV